MTDQYSVDDRGDRVQFYDVASGDVVGEINREDTVNGVQDQSTWDGDPGVTAWAIANGYPEVETMARAE